ncbi:MAG: hypothetical protein H2049_05575 [Porphyrobacter sp.]|nr:hypothetical protein [Porphyrobacter sp.]
MSRTIPRLSLLLAVGTACGVATAPALAAESGSAETAPAPRAPIMLATTSAAAAVDAAAMDAATAPQAVNPVAVAATAAAAAAAAQDGEDLGGRTPLGSEPLGQELFAKWVPVPNGESGAPRQGWLGTADGFFTREAHLAYTYVDGDGFDAHQCLARMHFLFTRRLWTGVLEHFPTNLGRPGGADLGSG